MLNLLFPKVCYGCTAVLSTSEDTLCIACRHALPIVSHHINNSKAMKDIFFGRFSVNQATALLKFEKTGVTQKLMHDLKYRGHKKISAFFGKWLGQELSEIASYGSIDLVIPVPLHKQKLKKRGYNQVEGFGKQIAIALKVDYRDDILLKITKTKSQVFKGRFKRVNTSNNDHQIFTVVNQDELKNKHILLVDDIVTTGATLENCANQLLKGVNVKLSIATIAIA